MSENKHDLIYRESMSEEAQNILGEAKMVIPGVQTIFGFQLVAVFNLGFSEKLSPVNQYVHLGAMVLLLISMALLMSPAAFHRRSHPELLSSRWVKTSSLLLAWGMNLFMVSVAIDTYLISQAMKLSMATGFSVATLVFVVFLLFWSVFPRYYVK